MGAFTPIVTALPTIAGVTSAIKMADDAFGIFDRITGHSDKSELRQLQERQRLEQQQAYQKASLARQQDAEESRQAESERQKALKRAVARQRAQFGSQGVGSIGGSSDAVLLGLFEESDEDRMERERLDTLRSRTSDVDLAQNSATNLLLATQLAEKNNLKRYYFS